MPPAPPPDFVGQLQLKKATTKKGKFYLDFCLILSHIAGFASLGHLEPQDQRGRIRLRRDSIKITFLIDQGCKLLGAKLLYKHFLVSVCTIYLNEGGGRLQILKVL